MSASRAGKMDGDTLSGKMSQLIEEAKSFAAGDSAKARETATNYYHGKPYGDEKIGRSSIVSREVAEVVESVLPMLLEPLAAADDLASFQPQGPEDEAAAEQATEYVNWIFRRDNTAFDILYDTLKDGLLNRLGVVKVTWRVEKDADETAFEGLDDAGLGQLLSDGDVKVVQHTVRQGPDGQQLHDVRIRRTRAVGRVVVEAIPPSEFLYSPAARSMDDSYLKAHRVTRTVGELLAEGYDKALLDSLPDDDGDDLAASSADFAKSSTDDGVNRRVTITECYLRIDVDGDGLAERRRIVVAGAERGGATILSNEPCADVPFAAWSPIRAPHQLEGFSLAEFVLDLQRIKSWVMRGVLDSVNLTNNPRIGALVGQVELDDLLTARPGGVVRMNRPDAVVPIQHQFIGAQTLPVLGMVDGMIERRSGVSQAMQGLDMDALAKGAGRTATGAAALMGASQQRVALILRLYAERLLSRMYRLILRCVIRHQDAARVVRLRGSWTPVDPRPWNADMDLSVGVGIGLGDKTQRIAVLQDVLTAQKEALQAGGLGGMVGPQQIYATLKRLAELGGLKNADAYFQPPQPMGQTPAAAPQPTADMLVMREIEMAKLAQRAQSDAAELALKERLAMAELALKERLSREELRVKQGGLGVDALKVLGGAPAARPQPPHFPPPPVPPGHVPPAPVPGGMVPGGMPEGLF